MLFSSRSSTDDTDARCGVTESRSAVNCLRTHSMVIRASAKRQRIIDDAIAPAPFISIRSSLGVVASASAERQPKGSRR